MSEPKYYHITASGEVKEISHERFTQILLRERKWLNQKLIARVLKHEVWLHKGRISIFTYRDSLLKILRRDNE